MASSDDKKSVSTENVKSALNSRYYDFFSNSESYNAQGNSFRVNRDYKNYDHFDVVTATPTGETVTRINKSEFGDTSTISGACKGGIKNGIFFHSRPANFASNQNEFTLFENAGGYKHFYTCVYAYKSLGR